MIAVIGLGFVGLTTAVGFAEKGFAVTGYDCDPARRSAVQQGIVPFHEPGLDEALRHHSFVTGRLTIAEGLCEALAQADAVFLCVGTPSDDRGHADLTALREAIREIVSGYDGRFRVVVIKSTVPPSTTAQQIAPFIESLGLGVGREIGLANNPEFLREGTAWDDFMSPDRIVIGADDQRSADLLRDIYQPFAAPLHLVSLTTSEFIKYLSNTLLSTMISFANEMAMVAETIEGIDIRDSFRILYQDKRWSGSPAQMSSYVYPGCGYGGYCLPKDTQALYAESARRGFEPMLLKSVIDTNSRRKLFLVERLAQLIKPEQRVGILGLSFKPGSDDVRDSASKFLIEGLLAKGYRNLSAYDPLAGGCFQSAYALPISYCQTMEELCGWADHLVLATAWPEFLEKRELLKGKPLHDLRYFLPADAAGV